MTLLDPKNAIKELETYKTKDGLSMKELVDSRLHGGLTYNVSSNQSDHSSSFNIFRFFLSLFLSSDSSFLSPLSNPSSPPLPSPGFSSPSRIHQFPSFNRFPSNQSYKKRSLKHSFPIFTNGYSH